MKKTIVCKSLGATEKLSVQIGKNLRGGEVIEFVSDVGGGKTTFVRGLVSGAGSHNHVSSPTFKISNVYKAPDFDIHHFDFYRLHEAGLIEHELEDVLQDKKAVIIVEWSDIVEHVLPTERVKIAIETTGEESRAFSFNVPESLAHLLDDVVV